MCDERIRPGLGGDRDDGVEGEIAGMVFDVQRFSIHDGPGIRTTVFLKGCALRCAWCQNPEGLQASPELLFEASECLGCGSCAATCSKGAIHAARPGRADASKCHGCGECVRACPARALHLAGCSMTVSRVLEQVERDAPFYRNSGGGITLSGGEPLLQSDFAIELARKARGRGMTTVLQTSGHVPPDVLEAALPFVDIFFFDLKLMDTERHRRLVGAGNERILENARLLTGLGAKVEYRRPLLPGINDGAEELALLAAFLHQQGCPFLRIVPYHGGYLSKTAARPVPEEIRALAPPSMDHLAALRERLRGHGIEMEIDG